VNPHAQAKKLQSTVLVRAQTGILDPRLTICSNASSSFVDFLTGLGQ